MSKFEQSFVSGGEKPEDNIDKKENKEMKETAASAIHCIASVFDSIITKVEEVTKKTAEVIFDNPIGKKFKEKLPRLIEEAKKAGDVISNSVGIGSKGVKEVNEFLKEKGFNIQLEDSKEEKSIYAASVLDIKVKWPEKGEREKITLDEKKTKDSKSKEVDGVYLKEVESFYESSDHEHPIAELETDSGYKVFITQYDKDIPSDPYALSDIVEEISKNKQKKNVGKKGILFPMIDYHDQGEIDWVKDATVGEDYYIAQALYEHKLRINEFGARAQAAAAAGGKRFVSLDKPSERIVINGSFLVWFEKDGVVYFSAKVNEDNMKDPGSLE